MSEDLTVAATAALAVLAIAKSDMLARQALDLKALTDAQAAEAKALDAAIAFVTAQIPVAADQAPSVVDPAPAANPAATSGASDPAPLASTVQSAQS